MPHDIATLLYRNLHDVFGENDAARRRIAIEEIFHEDAVFYEIQGVHQGWDNIDRIAGEIRSTHPDFAYTEIHPVDDLHSIAGRTRWISGRPNEAPAYAGTDIIVARDGRIAAVYLFFDDLPF